MNGGVTRSLPAIKIKDAPDMVGAQSRLPMPKLDAAFRSQAAEGDKEGFETALATVAAAVRWVRNNGDNAVQIVGGLRRRRSVRG